MPSVRDVQGDCKSVYRLRTFPVECLTWHECHYEQNRKNWDWNQSSKTMKPFIIRCIKTTLKLLSHWYFASKSRDIFPATCRIWLIPLAALNTGELGPISRSRLISTESFAPIVKWSSWPHGLFAPASALHAWERTHHPLYWCDIHQRYEQNLRHISSWKYCIYMS